MDIRFYFLFQKSDGKSISPVSFYDFPVLLPTLLSGGNTGHTGAIEGTHQPGGTLGAFSPSCPANRPQRPAAAPAPSSSVSGTAPLGPRPCPRWAAGPRRENPRTRLSIWPPWAPNGSIPICRTSPVYAAVSPLNPPRPHSYPGEKARIVAPAPLRSCRNFVRS